MQFSTTTLITLLAGVGMAQFSQFPPCAVSSPFLKHHTHFDLANLLTHKQQSCLENSVRLQTNIHTYFNTPMVLICKQATSCSKTNTACLCADQAYQAAAASCIEDTSGCSVSDEITALEVFEQLCNTSGTP